MASGVVLIRLGLVAALCLGVEVRAADGGPWLAVARVSSDEDGALLERVRGQSSDLPVELRAMPGPSLEGTPQDQWRSVVELADAQQARAVLWFQRSGSELRVHFAEPGSRHLFVRIARLEGQPGALEWSAGAEAVALVVRSALRAVEAGTPLGDVVEVASPLPAPATPETEREPTPMPPELWSMPPAASDSVSLRWQVMVGGVMTLDGYESSGHQGLLLASGWEFRTLRIRLQVLAGLEKKLPDGRTDVKLEQYAGGLWLDTPLIEAGNLRWGVGAGLGLLIFGRSTESYFGGIIAAKPRFVPALLAGPDTSLRWRFSQLVAMEATVAADAVFGRPRLGYSEDGNFVPRNEGWAVRPRFALALVLLP
ncbi:FAD-binding oxidoreductase [Myxococcus sp. AM011]|uniref:FAD-binding oxidoreductase n=1 Tax=Myxococcus sp. AM011 TaxID=2745200 RepID=UPI001595416F|nr:FAD-binding oxidoreductase [Myxococcus sp. AM011]NVJ25706.1 FAD-binding oxidoreductase [Myxococcus sp. AM011]